MVAVIVAACVTVSVGVTIPRVSQALANRLASQPQAGRAESYLDNLPVSFEANLGQVDPAVRFVSRLGGKDVFLTGTSAVFASRDATLTLGLVGANPQPSMAGAGRLAGTVNYLIGNDPTRWHTDIATYQGVTEHEVYPGVDLVWRGSGHNLEYDFVVAPGASPARIALAFTGASVRMGPGGELMATLPGGATMRQGAPALYQDVAGKRRKVAGGFRVAGGSVGFWTGRYDRSTPLVIDPLVYSTFLGGSGVTEGTSVVVDAAGSAYVTGRTRAPDFLPDSSLQPFAGTAEDAFVLKVNAAGTAVIYATYLGGNASALPQAGGSIGVDASGNAHVFGLTSAQDFPTFHAAQPAYGGGAADAFVSVLNAAGTGLLWSTYLGGSGTENVAGPYPAELALDASGNTYVAGSTRSSDFPTLHPLFPANQGGADAYVTEYSPTGALLWSTTLGGFGDDTAVGVALDASGNVYVGGNTGSFNPGPGQTAFPTTSGSFDPAPPTSQPAQDPLAFVTKFSPGGADLVWSTFLPATSQNNSAFAFAVSSGGAAVIGGSTQATDLPQVHPLACCTASGGIQGWVTELSADGSAAAFSSYLSTGTSGAYGLAFDAGGHLFVSGESGSATTSFPALDPLKTCATNDLFAMKIDPTTGTLLYATCVGPLGDPQNAVAVDAAGNAYLTGDTNSSSFPLVHPIQSTITTLSAFLAKMSDLSVTATSADVAVSQVATPSPAGAGKPLTYSVTASNAGPDPARGAAITDVLSPALLFRSATSTAGPCGESVGIVTCPLGTLAAGSAATATVVATPSVNGTVTATATASSADPDPNPANNSVTTTTQVTGTTAADLSVTQGSSPSQPTQGLPLTYNLSMADGGPATAAAVVLTDRLPAGVTFVSAVASQGTCAQASGTVTCSIGDLAALGSATATVVVTATSSGPLTATATVTSPVPDPNPANNTAIRTVSVQPPTADLAVSLSAIPAPATAGSPLTYGIGLSNAGPSPADGAVVTATLAPQVTFVSASSGCSNAAGVVTCSLGTLPAGQSEPVNIVTTPAAPGAVVASVSASANPIDPNPANNHASVSSSVIPPPLGGTLPSIAVAAPPPAPVVAQSASSTTTTATCPAGTTEVGGGGLVGRIDGSQPINGLKLNGSLPSDVSGTAAASGSSAQSWAVVGAFAGQSETGDQARPFALCSSAAGPGPSTVVVSAPVGVATEGNPPLVATATCPASTHLVGGGALSTPASVPSLKPIASYPSDASGVPALDGARSLGSWSAYGGAGQVVPGETVVAYAMCAPSPANFPIIVARVDAPGPQLGTTSVTATVSCPPGTQLLQGGFFTDETGGRQPQQGVHILGTYPSDAAGNPVGDGTANPSSWTDVTQSGGQESPGTAMHVTALCAVLVPPADSADVAITMSAPPTGAAGVPYAYTLGVTNYGPAPASGPTVSDPLPAGLTFVSATGSRGRCSFSAPTVTCGFGFLDPGGSAMFVITVTPTVGETITNTATVSSATPDAVMADNSASASTSVVDADLALTGMPANVTTNAPSPRGAVVTYATPTAVDDEPGAGVGCDHPSGSTFAIGATTVTCSASDPDDTPSTVTGTFSVTVVGAAGQTTALISTVQSFNLPPDFATSLTTKLQGVLSDLASGANTDACNQLSSFINQARAQSGKMLRASQANMLIVAAKQIQAVIGC